MGWLDISSPVSLGSVLSSVTLSFADAAGELLRTWPDVCLHVSVSVAPVCCCYLSGTLGTSAAGVAPLGLLNEDCLSMGNTPVGT